MRIVLAIPLLLIASACNVSKDGNSVTVSYDQNTAENTVADVSNTAQNVAADIGNDVKTTGETVQNKVADHSLNSSDNTTANSSTNKE